MIGASTPQRERQVALLPWGDLIEDFLNEIGVSLDQFATQMTGGWLFGYIDALRLAGIHTTVYCFSANADRIRTVRHEPTGASICILPPSKLYMQLRRRSSLTGIRGRLARHIAPYLATPVRPLMRELRRSRCRALLCQEYEYPRFDACVAAGLRLGQPVFATFQGGTFQKSRIERLLRPLAIRMSAGLIIAAEGERSRVRKRYRSCARRIDPTINPLDTEFWYREQRAAARLKLGLPAEARIAVWHGRIDIHHKGLDTLLDAWRKVWAERSRRDFRLVLVGAGKDSAQLRGLLQFSGVGGVIWRDEYVLDRALLRSYLSAADTYVFSSRHEGFPVAPMEAMACGLPVIATAVPGIAEILGNSGQSEEAGGVLVSPEDAAALAVQMIRILSDEALGNRLGQLARRRAEMRFSLEAVGRQLSALLFGLEKIK